MIKEYPLSKKLLVKSYAWQLPNSKKLLIATKGAPEAIVNLCRVSQKEKNKLIEAIENMTTKGFRVLVVAKAFCEKKQLPE